MPGDIIICRYGKKRPEKNVFFLSAYFLVFKRMTYNSSLTHPWERLPQPATNVLDIKPEVNFQLGRFYIHETEFESRIATISFQFWRFKHLLFLEEAILKGSLTKDLFMVICKCILIF